MNNNYYLSSSTRELEINKYSTAHCWSQSNPEYAIYPNENQLIRFQDMDRRSKCSVRYGRKKITFSGSMQLMVIAAAFHSLSFSVLFDFVRLIFRFTCESQMHSRPDMHKHVCLSGHQLWHISSAYADVDSTILVSCLRILHVRVCARNKCKNDKCVHKRSNWDSTQSLFRVGNLSVDIIQIRHSAHRILANAIWNGIARELCCLLLSVESWIRRLFVTLTRYNCFVWLCVALVSVAAQPMELFAWVSLWSVSIKFAIQMNENKIYGFERNYADVKTRRLRQ